jgi:hypothetical protein
LPLPASSYLLSIVIELGASTSPATYALITVTTGVAVHSFTLNATDTTPRWVSRGDLQLPFVLLGNAVVSGDRGRLFVLGRGPDALLMFDLVTEKWEVVPVVMPHGLTTVHLFLFDGRLFMVFGGVGEFGQVERVVVGRWMVQGRFVVEGGQWDAH